MSSSPKPILLFGDQSVEKLSGIQTLVRNARTNPAAKRFLEEATDVVQLEFSRLNRQDHGWNKSFGTLLGLAEDHNLAPCSNTVVSTVLMCVGRLGQLIVDADHDPTILGSTSAPVDIVALCGGLLPAAAAMAANDTSQLFALSKDIISVGIRLAVEVQRRAHVVESGDLSWGKTYTGISEDKVQKILDQFHTAENVPRFRHIAIGVTAQSWLTLIGPPSSLARLAAWSPELGEASCLETDVPGPIHSRCLPTIDTSKVVGVSPLMHSKIDRARARMYSPDSCREYRHATLGALLGEVVEDIAHNVLRVTQTIQECVSRLDDGGSGHVLHVMGPTNHLAAMKQALKTRGVEFQLHQPPAPGTEAEAQSKTARGGSDLVAIVGMSGRFPGSESVEAFWEDLVAGKCQIKEIPKSRFDLDVYFDPTGEKKNSTTARHGCFLDKPGLFDHRLFNISPREAAQMDPAHRLLLTVGYEALQQAGYAPEGSLSTGSSRIATYFGQAADEWQEILNQKGADIYYVPGFSRAFGPARLHYQYKWSGPSYALDSACSTSASAVSMACSALIARECDTALAGGASVLTSPNTFSGLSRAGMLSTTGGCRTYHDDADGYCRAEGAGVVVLKRLEDALLDNDNVLAVIRGSARTYSAAASSMTHPSSESQRDTYTQVLQQACLSAEEIAYVEMHGTGTQAGDVEELASVASLSQNRKKDNVMTVGAVKAAVGHGEGASAVTSLIKVIMMLRERLVPPQPGGPFQLNKKFPPLSTLNIKIATKAVPLKPSPRGDRKIKALVNSFDASGGNVSLAVEEPPARAAKMSDPREWHVVAVSARSAYSLKQNGTRLLDYLERHPETKLADLAYTTTARRVHEPLRCAYTGSSTGDIVRQLRLGLQTMTETSKTGRRSRTQNRIFLFTGQGSHYAGMGQDLYRCHDGFRATLQGYQEIATSVGLPNFVDLISDREHDKLSSPSTTKTQLAIVALEIAVAGLMKTWGIVPDVVIGHSLGEYAAMCVSGVLSVSDTLFLVGRRASLMEKHLAADTFAMLAGSVTEEALRAQFAELGLKSCNIACVNAPTITVASGTLQDLELLQKHMATTQGLRTKLLRVPYGFHSSQIDPILDEYQRISTGVHFAKPQIPIISTLTGKIETESSAFSPAYLAQQARQKVNFVQALETCRAAGLCNDGSVWFEIGPDPVCIGLARRTLEDIPVQDLVPTLKSGHSNWRTISSALERAYESGFAVNWPEFHKCFTKSLSLLDLPTYAFDSRDFWTPYKEPVWPNLAVEAGTAATKAQAGPPPVPGFPTSTLHRVEDEKMEAGTVTATFSSCVSEPKLLAAVQGHAVNGHTICPLGIFHDMALTAAKYVFTRLHGNVAAPHVSIQGMEMTHAFVLTAETLLATIYVTGVYRAEDKLVEVEFKSKLAQNTIHHGKCLVTFPEDRPSGWQSDLSQTLFLVNSRVDSLRELATIGKAHRLAKPVVYQLFSGLVSYGPVYQALEDVIMDHSSSDAIGTVRLPDTTELGQFHTNPYWTDAVLHLAGFVLNSGLRYSHEIVCLATGFQKWRSSADLLPGGTYTSYVCMQEQTTGNGRATVVSGDCYVFDGKQLVQATFGIKFLKLKRVALNTVLGVSEPRGMPQYQERKDTTGPPHNEAAPLGLPTTTSDSTPLTYHMASRAGEDGPEEAIRAMLLVVASESGCTMEDMTDDAKYADLGIDSVMSITIFSMVNRSLGIDLPASFFMENETIGESKAALRALLQTDDVETTDEEMGTATPCSEVSAKVDPNSPTEPETQPPLSCAALEPDDEIEKHLGVSPHKQELGPKTSQPPSPATVGSELSQPPAHLSAEVKHYQGARSPESTKIFFLADESGSTFGYMYLPNLGGRLAIYGVDSPFASKKSAADVAGLLELDVPTLAATYLAAIRREQPSGPYMLGGVSSGAVLALECARQLLDRGHEVQALFVLDCPSPSPSPSPSPAARPPRPGRRPSARPGQAEHVKNTAAVFGSFDPPPLPSRVGVALQVLPRDAAATAGARWSDLVPLLRTTEIEAPSGSFLSTVNAASLGTVLAEALANVGD